VAAHGKNVGKKISRRERARRLENKKGMGNPESLHGERHRNVKRNRQSLIEEGSTLGGVKPGGDQEHSRGKGNNKAKGPLPSPERKNGKKK